MKTTHDGDCPAQVGPAVPSGPLLNHDSPAIASRARTVAAVYDRRLTMTLLQLNPCKQRLSLFRQPRFRVKDDGPSSKLLSRFEVSTMFGNECEVQSRNTLVVQRGTAFVTRPKQ